MNQYEMSTSKDLDKTISKKFKRCSQHTQQSIRQNKAVYVILICME